MQNQRDTDIRADRTAGLTLKQLKAKYGLSQSQLSRITSDIGVDKTPEQSKPEWVLPRLEAGKTARELAIEADVPLGKMNMWIRKCRGTYKSRNQSTTGVATATNWDNEAWFRHQYETLQLGMPTIAKAIGKSVGFTSGRLRRYGIEVRGLSVAMAKFRNRPDVKWCQERYVQRQMSVSDCAHEWGISFDIMLDTLREYGIELRTASTQHIGELNEFFGKTHTEETRILCDAIGAQAGKEYWITGDVDAKKLLQSELSAACWSDSDRRRLSSERIAALCAKGLCNPKSQAYVAQSGAILLMRSSWEVAVARYLDGCGVVSNWNYEDTLIQYMYEGDVRIFVVDFTITWTDSAKTYLEVKNKHLCSQPKEQAKLAALAAYASARGEQHLVIDSEDDIKTILNGYISPVVLLENRFEVPRKYLESPALVQETMVHELVALSMPWSAPRYSNDELTKDIDRLLKEKLGGYWDGELLRSTAPNSGGMPGKLFIVHYQPHFWSVPVRNSEPVNVAFSRRDVIEKCLRISISEKESLSTERLPREITHHFSYGRTSHFAPGFARNILRLLEAKVGTVFDPCCGWGGRMLGCWAEGLNYSGCDLSEPTVVGLRSIATHIQYDVKIYHCSCFDVEWAGDWVVTSPPFYDVERYLGPLQPWMYNSRDEWLESFVRPFAERLSNRKFALYLNKATLDDFKRFLSDCEVVEVSNQRHSRMATRGCEYLMMRR